MNPRVSVLMPVRNGLPWLREALESLASQTLTDFELVNGLPYRLST
jgi:glycosyltransferase involved in cell wall biosynthesis